MNYMDDMLEQLSTKELEAELRRRKEKQNVKVGAIVVALDWDELNALRRQLDDLIDPVPF